MSRMSRTALPWMRLLWNESRDYMTERNISAIEGKHYLTTLLFLMRNPDCMKTELYSRIPNNPNMPRKLNDLEEMGLITQKRVGNRGTTALNLTEKGIRITKLIEMIESELKTV